MSLAYDLKQKRAALVERLQQLERERFEILEPRARWTEPDYQASALNMVVVLERSSRCQSRCSGDECRNKRQAVLEVLREAGEPISVTDCAAKFAVKLGIPSEPENLSDIASACQRS